MKILKICSILLIIALSSCYDDKGNYDYHEVATLNIENIPELIEVLGNSDHIIVKPKITSSFEGEITDANPNFEFGYRVEFKTGGTIVNGSKWVDLNPSKRKDLDTLASLNANTYLGWFTVTDKRTGVTTSAKFEIKVASPTSEGYMVLCNEGANNRVRMDMISVISKDRIVPAYDLLSSRGLPELKNATKIGFYPNRFSQGDMIYVLSESGAYKLNKDLLTTKEANNMKFSDFILPNTVDNPLVYATLNDGFPFGSDGNFIVTDKGNIFFQDLSSAGGAFEYPINTPIRGQAPAYRVAPYIGISPMRPGNGSSAIFYDIDNQRFIGWVSSPSAARQTCTPVPDPAAAEMLFSFKTGMKLVYMENTRFSDGLVYAILQDNNGTRHIYGINMAGKGMKQVVKYESINAPEFASANKFAFHSQYPFMYYAVGDKVYSYNLGTKATESAITLPGETITMLKFNLYVQPNLADLNDKSDEFLSRQFELMVGSYSNAAKDINGGKLGFYKVNNNNNTLTKRIDYSGFAHIVDVVYRERR
ncbi:MAG: PKD-like family lipoprotein [Odoribacter sp.]